MAEVALTGVDHRAKRRVILGQLRPANTTAASLYIPPANVIGTVECVHVCNTTGTAATYRLFIHNTGVTYDETTALEFDKSCPANNSAQHTFPPNGLPMANDAGNIAVRTGTANALTFTAWGYELVGAEI